MSDPISAQAFYEPCSRGVIAAAHCPREQGRDISSARRRMVLAACVLASSMAFIDSTALTVALPKLRTFLGGDLAAVQWVLNGYILALASLTLIGGVLADAHGKAFMCALGCLLFAAASIACALAPSAAWLIIARVMQGTGAALLTPASLALIGATYPKDQRNSAIGIWAAATALTTAAGPVLGGWLTETFGWQAIFWINPPLALACLLYTSPPCTWPSAIIGLMMIPASSATKNFSSVTRPVSTSTSTIATWQALENVPGGS